VQRDQVHPLPDQVQECAAATGLTDQHQGEARAQQRQRAQQDEGADQAQ
jgi:hypothetical protein